MEWMPCFVAFQGRGIGIWSALVDDMKMQPETYQPFTIRYAGRLGLVIGMITLLLLPPVAHADPIDELGDAVKTVIKTSVRPYGTVFAKHYKSVFFEYSNGKHYAFLELHNKEGSRCTMNFDRKWHYVVGFHIYILNVPPAVRDTLQVQLMKNPTHDIDYEITKPLKHGDALELGRRDDSFFREVNFETGALLRDHPNAVIALIEDGLDSAAIARRITFRDPIPRPLPLP
jgi:hypothetical protein